MSEKNADFENDSLVTLFDMQHFIDSSMGCVFVCACVTIEFITLFVEDEKKKIAKKRVKTMFM